MQGKEVAIVKQISNQKVYRKITYQNWEKNKRYFQADGWSLVPKEHLEKREKKEEVEPVVVEETQEGTQEGTQEETHKEEKTTKKKSKAAPNEETAK